MKMNTTSIILLAAAAAGGYYFYTKNKSAKEIASKVEVEEDKEESTEEEKSAAPNSYGTPSGYGSSPSLISTSTSAPKQKLTVVKKLATGQTKFTDLLSKYRAKYKATPKKAKRIKRKKVSGFDNCVGLF